MTLRQRSIGRLRAHWKLAWSPLGLSFTAYGNVLYETPQQDLGRVLFWCGCVIAIGGLPALKRFVDEDPLREGNQKVALLVGFMLLFLVPAVTTAGKVVWGAAQTTDYRGAATSLGLIYFVIPLAVRWVEPQDFALRRLPGRIQRAAIFRTVANAAGIGAVAAFLSERFATTYPAPLISTALTLMAAMAVVTHKTFARVRKLCTQTHIDVMNLLRAMDELDDAKRRARATGKLKNLLPRPRTGYESGDKHADKRMEVRRSWDALKLDLRTTVDSGYRLLGLPFLAADAIAELEGKVLVEIEATDFDIANAVRDDLRAILNACEGRIDVLA
ncbi:hypothetical protein [Streptomyces microflavus]|uniref:hypothetical protein n=1 Tax=Streptomyces microflavus TaxID=1919 RepID=UPI00331C5F01